MLSCRTNPPTNPMTIMGGLEESSDRAGGRSGEFWPDKRRLAQRSKDVRISSSTRCTKQLEHLPKKDDLRAQVVAQGVYLRGTRRQWGSLLSSRSTGCGSNDYLCPKRKTRPVENCILSCLRLRKRDIR
jgi:hypothetical protein